MAVGDLAFCGVNDIATALAIGCTAASYVDIRDDGWSLYRAQLLGKKRKFSGGLVLIGIVRSSGRASRLIRTLQSEY